jgi:hypothetical protein
MTERRVKDSCQGRQLPRTMNDAAKIRFDVMLHKASAPQCCRAAGLDCLLVVDVARDLPLCKTPIATIMGSKPVRNPGEGRISMTTIVMDVGGPRANTLMAEGLSHFASVSSTHDIFVLGNIVSTQKIGEQLRQECARADYVFVAPGRFSLLEIVTELGLWSKTAVLDFRDSSELDIPLLEKCRAYFKRSWPIGPERRNRDAQAGRLFPLNFGAFAAFERLPGTMPDLPLRRRPIDVGFYFAPEDLSNPEYVNRLRLFSRLRLNDWNCSEIKIGHHTFGPGHGQEGRQAIAAPSVDMRWIDYMRLLTQTKIIFTATPYSFDGDNRTWEALWSGACVFMDHTGIPTPRLPTTGVECFYYDARDEKSIDAAIELAKTLLATGDGQERLARIGAAGRLNVITHHLSRHRAEYVLRLIESRARGEVAS